MNAFLHKLHTKSQFISMLVMFALLLLSYVVLTQVVFAGPQPNVYDGLVGHEGTSDPADDATWGSNFGWVSFNNCETPNGPCSNPVYGAHLNLTTGLLTGHGWSSNLGWVSFEAADVAICGNQPKLANTPNPTAAFKGWARAIVAPTDANAFWNGCISMSSLNGDTTPGYGVRYDSQTGNISGQAWGGELIGWLNFAAHMPTDQPVIYFFANPDSIQPGQSTQLEWNMTDIDFCVPQAHPDDANWAGYQIDIPMTQPFQTIPLANSTTYYMDCTSNTGQVFEDVAAQITVSGDPIQLGGPALATANINGDFNSTVGWQSGQDFAQCDLYGYDTNGSQVYASPIPNILAANPVPTTGQGSWSVPVTDNPTTFQIECQVQGQLQIAATSNTHEIWQNQPNPVVEFAAQSCVENATDPAQIGWNIQDVVYEDCYVNYVTPDGQAAVFYPSDETSNQSTVIWAVAGSYELICLHPITGAQISDQLSPTPDVVLVEGPGCEPIYPPGTPDPSIIFEEF